MGEKAPFEDQRETHGICLGHQIALRSGGGTSLCQGTGIVRYVAIFDGCGKIMWLTHLYRLVLSMVHMSVSLKQFDRRARM